VFGGDSRLSLLKGPAFDGVEEEIEKEGPKNLLSLRSTIEANKIT
jgi:hypothetical protein